MSGDTSSPAPRPTVKCDGAIFEASRPEVLQHLVDIVVTHWGWCVDFRGSAEELIAAGLATPDLFDIGGAGQRKTRTEFGDECTAIRGRGRQRGKWTLEMRFHHEIYWPTDATLDASGGRAKHSMARKQWLDGGGAQAERATAEILKRFRVQS